MLWFTSSKAQAGTQPEKWLLKLTKKILTLILLTTGQRGQIISALNVEQMQINSDNFVFMINNENLKQGKPGYKPELLKLISYPDNRLCGVNYLKEYLPQPWISDRTRKNLLYRKNKPDTAVKRDLISRWLEDILMEAGVDKTVFKAGSTRAATTSKASAAGVRLDELLRTGGWARN